MRVKLAATQTYYHTTDILRAFPHVVREDYQHGERTEEFENRFAAFCGVRRACALPSARVCFYYTLRALDLPPGSEVLLTPILIPDFVNMIQCNALTPKFVDMDIQSLNFSVEHLKESITDRTRVILITYLYGIVPYNLEDILNLAEEHGLFVVEDISQSLGASYDGEMLGTLGEVGLYSLSSFKTCSTFFGGIILSDNSGLVEIIERISREELRAPTNNIFLTMFLKILLHKLVTGDILFNALGYSLMRLVNHAKPHFHELLLTGNISRILGFEKVCSFHEIREEFLFFFTDFQAEMGMRQLTRVEEINDTLAEHARLLENLPGIEPFLPRRNPSGQNVYWRFPFYSEDIRKVKKILFQEGIETSQNALTLCSEEGCFKEYVPAPCVHASKVHANYLLLPIHGRFPSSKVLILTEAVSRVLDAQ